MAQQKILEEKVKEGNDKFTLKRYLIGNFLGKGGFAKCYQATQLESRQEVAIKIITKQNLVKNRAKQKLLSEIKIHRALDHPYIVRFKSVFEDDHNVYIVLQLCTGRSISDMVKKRKNLTCQQTRYYLLQLLSALQYLHANKVIHRDLKMANIFLSQNMQVKLGDFGLSAKLQFCEQRKRTMAGTPNYIAPQIIDGTSGHSYEVDLWSTGIICYALLFGRPPFQTSELKMTYSRIKNCEYSFPVNIQVPNSAKDFIKKTLVIDPNKRMTIAEMYKHPFLRGQRPISIPRYATEETPVFTKDNLTSQQIQTITQSPNPNTTAAISTATTTSSSNFNNSNSNPNTNTNSNTNTNTNINTNPSKIQLSPRNTFNVLTNSTQLNKDKGQTSQSSRINTYSQSNKLSYITQKAEKQKDKNERFMLQSQTTSRDKDLREGRQKQKQKQKEKEKDRDQIVSKRGRSSSPRSPRAEDIGKCMWDYVIGYVDYSTKYGLGYYLNNGCMGVYFNDSTIMSLQQSAKMYYYFESPSHSDQHSSYPDSQLPTDHNFTKKKMLLHKFQTHLRQDPKLLSALSKQQNITKPKQKQTNSDLIFVKQWLKTKHAIMFRLSNKIFQVDFFDNSQILLKTDTKQIKFKSKKGDEQFLMLSQALNDKQRETQLGRRIKYTKEILNSLKKDQNQNNLKGKKE